MNEKLLIEALEKRADEINEARDQELHRKIWEVIHSYAPGFSSTDESEDQPMPFTLADSFFTAAKAYNKQKYISQTLRQIIKNAESTFS